VEAVPEPVVILTREFKTQFGNYFRQPKKSFGNPPNRSILPPSRNSIRRSGELAQLVERLNGIEEVSGSNPLFSISLHSRYFDDSIRLMAVQDEQLG
jgi:hypothetical protein